MHLNREICVSVIVIITLSMLMFFSSRYAHGMERRPSIVVDQYENSEDTSEDVSDGSEEDISHADLAHFRNTLCDYAIKELIEKIHEEKSLKISERRQKWVFMGIGTITTIIPLIIVIIKMFNNNFSFSSSSNATLY